jgi:hypothetical protein
MAKNVPQGLKPIICFVAFAARLKPCPDTKPAQFRVFRSLFSRAMTQNWLNYEFFRKL